MKISLEQLIKETAGLNPVQFEAYCEVNGIQTEWLEVCVSDFNYGYYNVTLPDFNDMNVFAKFYFIDSDGSAVEIETY